ncbi:MAG: preprotein translocase subunit SecG [bacterium]
MYSLLIAIHLIASLIMILVVICQSSKGAEMGAVFGGGSSQTAFGSQGAGGFLQKVTVVCAVVFMITSLSLAILSSNQQKSLIRGTDSTPPVESTTPAAIPVETPGGSEEQGHGPTQSQEGASVPQTAPSPGQSTPSSPVNTP